MAYRRLPRRPSPTLIVGSHDEDTDFYDEDTPIVFNPEVPVDFPTVDTGILDADGEPIHRVDSVPLGFLAQWPEDWAD